ncbi:NAD(P)H-quinone oxidoreductase [Holzapfeliella floricola]|uniref:NAD(P)H-quinone oxidoreductase n=1 Tax=Holzapfeliella floricola TaxID=679249 RepID=UPI0007859B1F|nr:NAD(P)H-quinone oxidoreductase [Holzapfeliella floricola]
MKVVTTQSIKTQNVTKEAPIPNLKAGEVLIKVKAIGVNHVDLAKTLNSDDSSDEVLGLEVSGNIVDLNQCTNDFQIGQRVAALLDNSGYAEYVAVSEDRLISLPNNISYEQGAAIPESFLTAYQALFYIGHLRQNASVLIHAGASGVGSAATQLAKNLKNATVFTTSSKAKTTITTENGSDYAIDYSTENFESKIKQLTNQTGVDLILDFIGADYFNQNINTLAVDGQLVLIGNLGGDIVSNVNLLDIMFKRLTVSGTLLSTRSDDYKSQLIFDFTNDCFNLLEEGDLSPQLSQSFKLSEAFEAIKFMKNKQNTGKIILITE